MLKVTLKFENTPETYVIQDRTIIEKSPVLLAEIENLKPGEWGFEKAAEVELAPISWRKEAVVVVLENVNKYLSPMNTEDVSPEVYPALNVLSLDELTPVLKVAEFYGFSDFREAVAYIMAQKLGILDTETLQHFFVHGKLPESNI